MDDGTTEALLIAAAIVFCLYMLPWLIALMRKHPSGGAIFFLTLLLGWTGIGWIIALIWSFSATKQTVVVVNQNGEPSRNSDSRDF